ncbi:signal peptidase I [Saccharothrix sp. NPDC042600]|uniref:signal peptidase I n=1 Tax=Saccharothrix TaxID=2071 RepID=UPI0033E4E508|nr:signal peptidase I [Saccharothrix mutabilis subsp. capreolus]
MVRWWVVAGAVPVVLAVVVAAIGFALSAPVRGDSMDPALRAGDRVLANPFGGTAPQRLDVVTVRPPGRDAVAVKRVVGVGGDQVRITGGRVLVRPGGDERWHVLEWPAEGTCCAPDGRGGVDAAVVVPEGGYFVLGDNTAVSTDSREYGFVARADVISVVWRRVWPPADAGEVPRPRLDPM